MERISNFLRAGHRLAALLLAMLVLAVPVGAAPQAQSSALQQIDLLGALAIDDAGNGWAWAQSPGSEGGVLLRLESGAWRVTNDTNKDPALLPPGTSITKMVLSAKGDSGWASGYVSEGGDAAFHFLQLKGGAWSVRQSNLSAAASVTSLSINADNTDGWMVIEGVGSASGLLRLRNGAWDYAPGPQGIKVAAVGMSPDGGSGWAVGEKGDTGVSATARWSTAAGWTLMPGATFADNVYFTGISADNAGNGWLTTFELNENEEEPTTENLVRLDGSGGARKVDLDLSGITPDPDPFAALNALIVDGLGRGWVVGGYGPSDTEHYGAGYLTVCLRGDEATVIPAESVGLRDPHELFIALGAISPGGGHAWIGANTDAESEKFAELREPWQHNKPVQAAPLHGAGICFGEVHYCLRGVFAQYWERNGGLEQFGYPITPEVQEEHGGQAYTVQYTQRARLEYHPENRAPNNVLLGLLGNSLVEGRLQEAAFAPTSALNQPGSQFFRETQHNVGMPFLGYWQRNGGLPVFGLPRSEAFDEKSAADGRTYRVQYFERNRMEYHPENQGTRFEMLLGLLGHEQFVKLYGYTP